MATFSEGEDDITDLNDYERRYHIAHSDLRALIKRLVNDVLNNSGLLGS